MNLAQAQEADAQREFDRLSAGNITEITAAKARVEAAQATLNLAHVTTRFSGIVTESYPLPGDQVGAGATAFRIDDLSSLLVDVEVSEVDINSVSFGQPVSLTFDAILGKEYNGIVVEVAQTGAVSAGVVNFKVTVELTDADSLVKPGMTAAVNITVKELADVLLVPNRAVRLSDGERVVYVMENNLPVKKPIRLGSSSDMMMAGTSLPEDVTLRIRYLLEAQRERQRMYTSCGWFFDDFSRIEPINNVAYAAQAVRLIRIATGVDLSPQVREDLKHVTSERGGQRGDIVFQNQLNRAEELTRPLLR